MIRIAKSEVRKNFAEVITRAANTGERVKVTHYGKTLAVIVSSDDLSKLEACEQRMQEHVAPGAQVEDKPPAARPKPVRRRVARGR